MKNLSIKNIKNFYPWLIWFLASSFIFYKYLLQVSPSVMVNALMKTFSLTGAGMGNLAAFYFYAYLSMQLIVGALLDTFNPKRLIVTAILVCAFGAYIFAKADHLGAAEFGRLLIGIGGAFSAVGAMKLISLWFPPKRFALMSGLMMTMAMLGAIGGEAPLSTLISTVGWRHSIIIIALGGLVLAAAILFLIKDKSPQHASQHSLKISRFFNNISRVLKNRSSWIISIYSGLAFAPVSAFAGLWGVPFLMQKYGMSRDETAGLVSLIFVGFALGAPFGGWLSDKINRRKLIMIIGTSFSSILLTLIIFFSFSSMLVLGLCLFNFGLYAGFFFVSFAYIREINHHEISGTSIGFINMFNALGGALSEPLIGKLLDLGWQHKLQNGVRTFSTLDYQHALLVLPIALFVAVLLQFFIKETYCKQAM